jgi:nucleoid-associated protein YgaU
MILGAIVIVVVGVLVVNYFRGQEAGETIPPVDIENLGTVSLPTIHSVAEGEDLWKISERYYESGYNWVDLASANNLSNPSLIEEGQELSIPDVEAKKSTVEKPILSAETEGQEAISGTTYTVVRGDSLWDVAVRAYGDGYRWVDIASENDLVNPDIIHAGNVFVLPR